MWQFHEIFKILFFILGCDQVIASGSSTTPESLNAMTALTLLKGSQPKQVFDELLKKRKLNLNTKLKRQDVSAKIHIINSLAAISSFLETVHQCFYLGMYVIFHLIYFRKDYYINANFYPFFTMNRIIERKFGSNKSRKNCCFATC